MKITFAAARVAVVAAVFLGLLASSASAINDPIPGIDIVVKKNPGGNIMHATTDSTGKYVFQHLEPGTYTLEVPGKPKQTVTVGANGKLSGKVMKNGKDGVNRTRPAAHDDYRDSSGVMPKPEKPVTYRMKVWQFMQGQNGTQAMKENKPIVTKDKVMKDGKDGVNRTRPAAHK